MLIIFFLRSTIIYLHNSVFQKHIFFCHTLHLLPLCLKRSCVVKPPTLSMSPVSSDWSERQSKVLLENQVKWFVSFINDNKWSEVYDWRRFRLIILTAFLLETLLCFLGTIFKLYFALEIIAVSGGFQAVCCPRNGHAVLCRQTELCIIPGN